MNIKQYLPEGFHRWRALAATFLMLAGTGLASGSALAQGNAAAGEGKITVCLACHGKSGNDSLLPNVPMLGGQNEKYLLKQLVDIKSGTRPILLMTGMLNTLNEQDLADVAAWYSSQPAPRGAADPELVSLAQTLYKSGKAEIGVPACSACHSPTGNGNAGAGYPVLSGQDIEYSVTTLKAFRDGTRMNDDAEVMRTVAARLNDREIEALASYISGLH